MPLLSYLKTLLPEAPARILVLGWPDLPEAFADLPGELVQAEGSGGNETSKGPFDRILWLDSTEPEAGSSAGLATWVETFRLSLAEDGQLIIATPLTEASVVTRQRGALPTRHQARLRDIVRRVSESGLAIRREHDVSASENGGDSAESAGAAGWKILVAHQDTFRIRPYGAGDEADILRLFRACFHVERSTEHWHWKYVANPYGAAKISLGLAPGAESAPSGSLAAHYGGYPIPFWRRTGRRDRTFLGLQMGDTMIDPAYRDVGRGKASLLARTVRHFFAIHRDGSYGLYFGFNTGPIQRFCRWFIGGSQTIPVRYRVRNSTKDAGDLRLGGGYRIRRVESVGPSWDRFFRRVAPSYGFLVRRDAEYVDWRYLQCPDKQCPDDQDLDQRFVLLAAYRWRRLVGWSVFSRRQDRLVWGDALFDPRHARAAQAVLASALVQPELEGAEQIAGWFPEQPVWWHEELLRLGFVDRPEPEGLGMVALPDTEPEAFADLARLYYTMGDGDLF